MWYHYITIALAAYIAYRSVMAIIYGPKTMIGIGSSLAGLAVAYLLGKWSYDGIYPPSLIPTIPGITAGGRRR